MSERNQVTTTQSSGSKERPVLPAVDIIEDAGGITLLADMPGVTRDRLEVKVDGENLSIEGRVELEAQAEMRAIWAEVSVPRFQRTFTLTVADVGFAVADVTALQQIRRFRSLGARSRYAQLSVVVPFLRSSERRRNFCLHCVSVPRLSDYQPDPRDSLRFRRRWRQASGRC